MKVLCINKFFHIRGGADRYFFETMAVLEEHGHDVIAFSSSHSRNEPSPYARYFSRLGGTEDDLETMSLGRKIRMFVNGIYSFESARQLERLIVDTRPQIAHVHNILYQITPSIFPVLRRHEIPVVQSLHDWHIICAGGYLYTKGALCERCKGGRFFQCTLNRCYRDSVAPSIMGSLSKYVDTTFDLWKGGVDAFTVPATHMIERLSEWGFPPDKIHILRNPFSLAGLNPTYNIGNYVLWYGRLLRLKGVYTLLRAAKELRHVEFRMYGSGPEEAGVRTYMEKHHLTNVMLDTVTRWGPRLQQQVAEALCVVEPSEWWQPSPYVVWESFALGKAVVATNIGGTPEIIQEGVNGAMFEPGDWLQLAGTINSLLENRMKAVKWGKAARASIDRISSSQGFYSRLMEIYQAAAESMGIRL